MTLQEQELLQALNAKLPKNVDWKQGALDYISQRLNEEGESAKRFHLIKPYYSVGYSNDKINRQLGPFLTEMYFFLNVLSMLATDTKVKFLDVACGPGWTAHYLAKLNLEVAGFDISPEMVSLAQERLASDPFLTVEGGKPPAQFFVHDIEESPLKTDEKFDVVLLESALHHFVNPIATLRNLSQSLADDGIILIFEAGPGGEEAEQERVAIMEKYQTLERPYTREQLSSILKLSGFNYYHFLCPVNGLFRETAQDADTISNKILLERAWNITVAAKSSEALEKHLNWQTADAELVAYEGFYDPEYENDRIFRWAKSRATITLQGDLCDQIKLKISSSFPQYTGKTQDIYVSKDGEKVAHFQLKSVLGSLPSKTVEINGLSDGATIEIASDSVFSPTWFGLNDTRQLSFMVDLGTEES